MDPWAVCVIRSPEGKTMAYRRFGAGGCSQVDSQVDEGDQMADVAGMSDTIVPSHDVSRDIVNDDNDFGEDFGDDFGDGDDGNGSDDGDNGGDSDCGGGDGGGDDGGGDDDGGDDGGGDGSDGNGGDGGGSEKELIKSNGKKFTKNKVNRCAKDIFEQCYDGDWVTFKKVPHNVRMRLFNRFRTKYRWNRGADQLI